MIDADPSLLSALKHPPESAIAGESTFTGEIYPVDLAKAALDNVLDGSDLITSSALLDLVSGAWLCSLIDVAARMNRTLHAALSYDGHVSIQPHDAGDDLVIGLVNTHQRTDKGFGDALGAEAVPTFLDRARACGARVVAGESPWCLGSSDRSIMEELLRGWAMVALTMAPDARQTIIDWRDQRLCQARTGALSMRVGHHDVLALWST